VEFHTLIILPQGTTTIAPSQDLSKRARVSQHALEYFIGILVKDRELCKLGTVLDKFEYGLQAQRNIKVHVTPVMLIVREP
jgi:hypothetical protein